MVLYSEYVSYFESFKRILNKKKRQKIIIHYLIDAIYIENLVAPSGCHVSTLAGNYIERCPKKQILSYGNMLIGQVNIRSYMRGKIVLKESGIWWHELPDIDLRTVRYSTFVDLDTRLNKYHLLFRQLFDDYRLKVDTFHVYDIKIRYC